MPTLFNLKLSWYEDGFEVFLSASAGSLSARNDDSQNRPNL